MPELPEVETTRRSLADRIAGASVISAWLGKPLRWPLGVAASRLVGTTVCGVRRRGKYLLIDLDRGVLLVHLGMSGSLAFAGELPARGVHDHFELHTTRGTLRLNDPRRFGAVVWAENLDDPVARKLLQGLGVEPLSDDFRAESFHSALRARRAAIKQVLLAGNVVVGVGNIYASEALFLAGIHPALSAARVSRAQADRLHTAIRDVLGRALAAGGTTLRNYSSAVGAKGGFQFQAMVYGREGQVCKVCATPIRTLRQGQRSTFFCPKCQKSANRSTR